jgi:hypothetical protein
LALLAMVMATNTSVVIVLLLFFFIGVVIRVDVAQRVRRRHRSYVRDGDVAETVVTRAPIMSIFRGPMHFLLITPRVMIDSSTLSPSMVSWRCKGRCYLCMCSLLLLSGPPKVREEWGFCPSSIIRMEARSPCCARRFLGHK